MINYLIATLILTFFLWVSLADRHPDDKLFALGVAVATASLGLACLANAIKFILIFIGVLK